VLRVRQSAVKCDCCSIGSIVVSTVLAHVYYKFKKLRPDSYLI
jgi:hypothetical protein